MPVKLRQLFGWLIVDGDMVGKCFFILLCVSLLFVSSSFASDCDASIRVVEGQGARTDSTTEFSADSTLRDVHKQLGQILYQEYRVVDRSRGRAPLGRRTEFRVRDAQQREHVLSVTPLPS